MAQINGTTGRNASHWKYYLIATEQNVDIANNTSKLKVDVYLGATSYSRAVRGNISATHTVTVNGTNYTFTTGAYTIEKNATILLGSITTNAITHDADGKKSVSVSASSPDLAQASGYGPYSGSASGTVTLTTIPRTSSVACADGNIGSSTTININRASSTFTHTLKYAFGTLTGTIATKTSNTSIGWTIPTSFYAQIPNDTTGYGTITCETYSGDTLIGTSTCTFNAFVIESSNKPIVSATIVDSNATTKALTGDANKLVKYFSNAKVDITATAKNSATIKSRKVTCGDGKSSTSVSSTLNGVESGSFTVSATDSRGYTTSTNVNKTLINYIKLAITSLTIARESSTSSTVNISLKGNYFNASFGSVANTLELKWRYRIKGGTWSGYTSITPTKSGNTFSYSGTLGTTFDMNNSYEFEVVATDKLITDTKTKPVEAGTPLVDMWKDNVKVEGTVIASKFEGNITSSSRVVSQGLITPETGTTKPMLQGISMQEAYNNGYPHTYGNVINVFGEKYTGAGQLLMGWNGSQHRGTLYYRSLRDTASSWSNWGYIPSISTNLYENSSGTNGTVTLSESAANFYYLEIFYYSDDNTKQNSIKIYTPNGKKAYLSNPITSTSALYWYLKQINISGTSITSSNPIYVNTVGSSISTSSTNNIYITKVIGWR